LSSGSEYHRFDWRSLQEQQDNKNQKKGRREKKTDWCTGVQLTNVLGSRQKGMVVRWSLRDGAEDGVTLGLALRNGAEDGLALRLALRDGAEDGLKLRLALR
jgi:hypothetical protein